MPVRLGIALVVLALVACSDPDSHLSPAERAKRARGMSDDVWKVYSGAESGAGDTRSPDATPGQAKESK